MQKNAVTRKRNIIFLRFDIIRFCFEKSLLETQKGLTSQHMPIIETTSFSNHILC